MDHSSMRLVQIIESAKNRYGDKTAVIDGDRHVTYSELFDRVGRCAGLLKSLEVKADDRVCILSLNSHCNLEALFGAVWAGAIAAPLNYRLSVAELVEIIQMVEARVLFVDETFLDLARELQKSAGCIDCLVLMTDMGPKSGTVDYERGLANAVVPSDALRGGDDVATIFFTGGTTGLPKGVMQSHGNLVASAVMYVAQWKWTSNIILLGSAPMFHVAAAAVIPPVLLVGGTIVMMAQFDPVRFSELIEQHGITFANGVPTMLRMVCDAPGFAERDLSSLTGMNVGGAPIPRSLFDDLFEGFPNALFYNTYGMTEVTSAATVNDGFGRLKMPRDEGDWATIGYSLPLLDVDVFDAEDRPCEDGEVGEIRMRGPLVMKGYWNDAGETRKALEGGWLHSGDLGYRDEAGRFFLVDRLKDMVITGGEKVYSVEVETVIRGLEGVADVAVIGLPDDKWGEIIHAEIVLDPAAEVTEQQVIDHCRAVLAGYKTPRSITMRNSPLPISGAGKVSKADIRAEYA